MKPLSFLLVDAGNTRVKWAVSQPSGSLGREQARPTSEVTASFIQQLAKKYHREKVVLSCVVPKLLPYFERAFAGRIEIVRSDSPALGFSFDYPKPQQLGADRLAAAVAAYAEGSLPAIIVACGTATAFSVLDRKGRFCGGAIAPGLQTQLAALLGATAQLPKVNLATPQRLPAKSTEEAVRAGLIVGFQGGVNEIVQQLTTSLGGKSEPWIFLTGGNAEYLMGAIDGTVQMRPLLVLEGLHIMALRHFSETP